MEDLVQTWLLIVGLHISKISRYYPEFIENVTVQKACRCDKLGQLEEIPDYLVFKCYQAAT